MLCHACHMIDMQVSFHRSICLKKPNRLIHFLIVFIVIWARPARNTPMNYTSWNQRWQIITDSGYFGRSMEGVTRVKRDRDMRLSKKFCGQYLLATIILIMIRNKVGNRRRITEELKILCLNKLFYSIFLISNKAVKESS